VSFICGDVVALSNPVSLISPSSELDEAIVASVFAEGRYNPLPLMPERVSKGPESVSLCENEPNRVYIFSLYVLNALLRLT
jgi:hypothetical protein